MKLSLITFLVVAMFLCSCSTTDKQDIALKKQIVENDLTFSHIPKSLRNASWIWGERACWYDIVNSYALFRKTFELPSKPKSAKLFITADQCYRLYVNGSFVCSGPERGYQENWKYDSLDISKYLQAGKNVIAVRAYCAGRGTFAYISKDSAGVLFALECENLADAVVSGKDVKALSQKSCSRNTAQYSMQLNDQEHIDMRKEPVGWKNLNFNDSHWRNSHTRPFGVMPWNNLKARVVPMLLEKEMALPLIVSKARGKSLSDKEQMRDVALLFNSENLVHTKISPTNAFQYPLVAEPAKNGEVSSFVVDFGKVVVGRPVLEIKGAVGGEIIDTRFGEVLKTSTNDTFESTGCYAHLANRLICRKGAQEHDFFHPMGARYITIRVRKNKNSRIEITPKMISYIGDVPQKCVFETSDAYINKIWQACKHTQEICTLDAYVDTPHREQAQWWGDARVQSWNTFFISGETRYVRKGIDDIAQMRSPNGLTYGHAPTMAHFNILPDFSLIWVLTLWDYYWQTADASILAQYKDVVDGLIAYFETHKDKNTGLLYFDERYWLFLDWTDIHKEGQPALLNLWYLHALERLTILANEAGLKNASAHYSKLAFDMRLAITKTLLDKADGLICDGVFKDGSINKNKGIHAQTIATLCNIDGFDSNKAIKSVLLPYVKRNDYKKGDPSAYWSVYVLNLLVEKGYDKEVFDFICRKWKTMAEFGSTFESFNVDPFKQQIGGETTSHAWSAHPVFLLPKILSGIRQTKAGWQDYTVSPNKIVKSAHIVYPTPKGNIEVKW